MQAKRAITERYALLHQLRNQPSFQGFYRFLAKQFDGKIGALIAHLMCQARTFSGELDSAQKKVLDELKSKYGCLETFESDEGYLGDLDKG